MTDSSSRTSDAPMRDAVATRDEPSIDELFDALAHRRRRHVLRCLREQSTPMVLADLADEVAAREVETPLSDAPAEVVDRVHLSLHHSHVPKLADAGLIEYAEGRELVALSTASERVESVLDLPL